MLALTHIHECYIHTHKYICEDIHEYMNMKEKEKVKKKKLNKHL